ncbi:MAG: hypothetical protein SGCHY_003978 [Lobulomycetales sp.]
MYISSIVLCVLGLARAGQTNPKGPSKSVEALKWPSSFFAAYTLESKDLATGEVYPKHSHLRWQDYSVQSRVDQCMSEGSPLVMNSLFIGQTAYIYTANFCIGVKLPIGITSDHWFVGANYKGKKLVDGVETHVFEKLDHYYYASVADLGRPVRVYAPLDPQRNRENDQYFGTFRPETVDPERFKVPSHCTVVSDSWTAAKMDDGFRKAADTCFGTGGPPGGPGGPPGGPGGPPVFFN